MQNFDDWLNGSSKDTPSPKSHTDPDVMRRPGFYNEDGSEATSTNWDGALWVIQLSQPLMVQPK
jgi:hypothetical protein